MIDYSRSIYVLLPFRACLGKINFSTILLVGDVPAEEFAFTHGLWNNVRLPVDSWVRRMSNDATHEEARGKAYVWWILFVGFLRIIEKLNDLQAKGHRCVSTKLVHSHSYRVRAFSVDPVS